MKSYLKQITYESNRNLFVAISIKGDQFVADGVIKAARLAKKGLSGKINYLQGRKV
jgi:hypothetical protein